MTDDDLDAHHDRATELLGEIRDEVAGDDSTDLRKRVALDIAAADYDDSDLDPVDPNRAAVDADPTLFVTEEQYEQHQNGNVSREELGARPDDDITTVPRNHDLIAELFTPRSRAILIDTWLDFGSEPVTITEVAERSDQLTRQTAHSHLDALENEFGIVVEAGKKGNATAYRLNYRNPIVQCVQMLAHIGRFGRTNLLIEREFLAPGPDGEPLDAIGRGNDDEE